MTKTVFNEDIKVEDLSGVRQLVRLEETDSTQNVARGLALEGNGERTLVLAASQTQGKGRLDRVWESQPGGIYMTLILKPSIGLQYLPDLSVMGGEVVSSTLRELYGVKTRIKLPNDVYAFHPDKKKWLKIAGILTESASVAKTPSWILLGVGLNLNNKTALDCAVSVREITGAEASAADFLKAFFVNFWARYSPWEYSSKAKG